MSEDHVDRRDVLDPAEEAALAALLGPPACTPAELDALARATVEAAGPALAGRRLAAARAADSIRSTRSTRRRRLARRLAPLIPVAAAAALALFLLRGPDASLDIPYGAEERALLADVTDQEFARLVAGHDRAAAWLLLAVGEGEAPGP
jgi:hypothetical protein